MKPLKKQEQNAAFSIVLIKLLQGFITSDEKKYWEPLLIYQETVRDYFATLGLSLHLSMDDGYAFLKQGALKQDDASAQDQQIGEALEEAADETDETTDTQMPTLVRRMPLSFDVSLLCILLREALEQFDSKVSDDHRLVLHRFDIYDLLKLFYEEKTDETKQFKKFDTLINRVAELGFLKELKGNQNSFEVRRIIKAQFDAEKLSEIKAQMILEIEGV
ncbi:MAG: hypothetical protein A3E82_03370 [Gammaproteobacteria bacterium RIFCSPHIGHO2_12_FULL_38_11]|nr:MAG: hypothetical protein A3E82_03370 [Gammaproteobacteria bacterium RIFCSPHIGHO2_12_FULL_38_11]